MSLITRLEPKLGRFAVPNLTVILIVGQVFLFVANMLSMGQSGAPLDAIRFQPERVMQGEVWRLVTYLFDPPTTNVIFAFLGWYLFYLMGTTLEIKWGTFRFNVYIGIGYLASIAMAMAYWLIFHIPGETATNGYLYGTVFLAFARMYPDFILQLMFLFPVKIRWLAMATWIVYAITFITDDNWLTRMMIAASVLNYLMFFGREIKQDMKYGHRQMQFRAKVIRGAPKVINQCRICGINSDADPRMQFRYCSKCDDDCCYCAAHLHDHEHVVAAAEASGE